MRFFLVILSLTFVVSCQPHKTKKTSGNSSKNNSMTASDTSVIEKLEKEIKELAEKIAKNENIELSKELNQKIEALRSELNDKIDLLDSKVSSFMLEQEERYKNFKRTLDSHEKNYVSIELFEALKLSLEESYLKKEELISMQIENSSDPELVNYLRFQITQIKSDQKKLKEEYKEYFKKSLIAWNEKLITLLDKKFSENKADHDELKKFIQIEVSRLNVNIEGINLKIKRLESNNASDKYSRPAQYSSELSDLKESLQQNQDLLNQLRKTAHNQINDNLITDIVDKQYFPCSQGVLKNNLYCHTIGTMILNLGGQFIDPTGYKRNKTDFIKYLVASGVSLAMVVNNTEKFLKPSDNEGRNQFNACRNKPEHIGLDLSYGLLGPKEVWPRAVLLSLFFEKIENEITKLDELGIINAEERRAAKAAKRAPVLITPATQINAWWRSSCYQQRFSATISDHTYGAAFDPQIENFESLEFYKEYIESHIFKNDTFGLTHPLQTSGLTFRTGYGAGKEKHNNKRLHLGIGSKVDNTGKKQNCDKWEYDRRNNDISLPGGCSSH